MAASIKAIRLGKQDNLEIHFAVTGGDGEESIIGTLSIEQVISIARGTRKGALFVMCRTIQRTPDVMTLIGRTFG